MLKYLVITPAMLLLAALLPARAADMPRQGTDSYTTVYVMTSSNLMKLGDRTSVSYEVAGASRNDTGGSMFNNMGARCVGLWEAIGNNVTDRGTCVDMDADGDQAFSTYEAKDNAGTHTYVGGTGKFTSLSGTATYRLQSVKMPDGRAVSIVSHKATWKLPGG